MNRILNTINSPLDLKGLDASLLQQLAQEIREEIIYTVSKNGGHLAPNLGVVELTLALHRVFETPKDKIIWDVGHQSYVHKLLTGRRDDFSTLRQFGGISGFPRPDESVHDAFATGHSSTSISAALGLALARDLKKEKHSVVAVIGDGAMTGGMAFEALNHAGHLQKDVIVVLNDNEMSIAHNVGAMSGYLSRLRTDPKYSSCKDEVEQLLRKIPAIGPKVLKIVDRLKDSLKYLVVPGMLFEELGFIYLGPIDGHNIPKMINILQQAKTTKGPVLVHVLTQKGRGYAPAVANADKFHGIGPFDIETGNTVASATPSYTEIFGNTLIKLAERDNRILGITAAMPGGTGLSKFAVKYPDRFLDVGIAEQHAITMSAGLAASGMKPVVAIYSTFLQRAYDQIMHDVCLPGLPVTFAIDRGGLVGDDGATHHGVFDFAFLRHLPNMVLMSPKDENELQHMLKTALDHNGPAAVRYPRGAGKGVPLDDSICTIPLGKAEVLREGKDITIVAIGSMVALAEQAAEALSVHGIETTVINARFIKPLDVECILKYAAGTGRLLTIEEHVLQGGFGSAVIEAINEATNTAGLKNIKIKRFGIPDRFVEHGARSLLLAQNSLTVDSIINDALIMTGVKRLGKKVRMGFNTGVR